MRRNVLTDPRLHMAGVVVVVMLLWNDPRAASLAKTTGERVSATILDAGDRAGVLLGVVPPQRREGRLLMTSHYHHRRDLRDDRGAPPRRRSRDRMRPDAPLPIRPRER